jgi:UDP-N-acetyl-2-amino-2-deoxyglucuronate dehydrogenase
VRKRRVVVVGLDHYHTTGWVESLELFPDELEIVAIYEPDRSLWEGLAPRYYDPHLKSSLHERHRATPFVDDLDTLIDSFEPDIALVTLSNRDMPGAIEMLANDGVHMLVDKPGAATRAAAKRAFGAADANNVKVATGLLRRYGRGWQYAHQLCREGRTGRLLSTESVFNTSSPFVRDPRNHLFSHELQVGGILIWLGVHEIDQLLWMTSERIVEVQALSGQVNDAGIDVEDVMSLAFRYESGAIGTLHCAFVLPRTMSTGYFAIRGEHGSVSVKFDGSVSWIGAGNRDDPIREETLSFSTAALPGYGSMAPAVIRDLLAAIDEDRQPLANGDALVAALGVIDAAYEAASTGTRVLVDWS